MNLYYDVYPPKQILQDPIHFEADHLSGFTPESLGDQL